MGETKRFGRWHTLPGVLLLVAALAACASPDVTSDHHDPYELRNREVFETNVEIDRALFKDRSGTGPAIPAPVRNGLSNFSETFSLPQTIVNDALQFNVEDVIHNSFRLAVNVTLGVGGLMDPATELGLEKRSSDFGETLHVWGFDEGAYLVLPILGPSTERDAVGKVVDLFTNPLGYVLPSPEKYLGTATGIVAGIGARGEFAGTVESVLYDSADPYAAARLLYLDNRRFQLSGGDSSDAFFDPYEELYGE